MLLDKLQKYLSKCELPCGFMNIISGLQRETLLDIGKLNKMHTDIRAVRKFLTDHDLIVKPADKNLGLTIMTRKWYITEVYSAHLDNRTYYRKETPNFDVIKDIMEKTDSRVGKCLVQTWTTPETLNLRIAYIFAVIDQQTFIDD